MDEKKSESPRDVADRFYSAFARKDGEAMAACYAARCDFSDPVFTGLVDDEVGDMWRMLTERAKDFSVTHEILAADDKSVKVKWIANYVFSASGNKVRNEVTTNMEFTGNLIHKQVDTFDLHKWARQALGTMGLLLGWFPPFQGAIGKKAKTGLAQWRAARFAAKK